MRRLPPELNTPATLHGLSAFTTLRTRHAEALLISEHLARLSATCTVLGLPAPDTTLPELPASSPPWGLLRLTVTSAGTFWSHRPLDAPDISQEGAALWLTDWQVHPQLGKHKTGNYLPYLLAGQEAAAHGAFEGLLRDGAGNIPDGSRTGLLLHLNGRWIVPEGGLPSVTRAAWLRELGQEAAVAAVSVRLLRQADHLWLCGAGVGVLPVGQVGGAGWQQSYAPSWPETQHPALVIPG